MAFSNCTFDAGPYGSYDLIAEAVVHGFAVISNEAETRRFRTFYPKRMHTDEWYVNLMFPNHDSWQRFSLWITDFFRQASDPHADTPQPIMVTIPSRNFSRQGFPSSAINFGDQFGKRVYRESVQFKSAHNDVFGSDFVGPRADTEAYFFYPPGLQPGDLVNPGPGPLTGVSGDDGQIYGGGGGGSHHVL